MEFLKQKQSFQPINRVIIFEERFANIHYIKEITDGVIITLDESLVLPIEDATIYNSTDGLIYAYNVSLDYKKEVEHLAEVEKNIIISQAFLYPGTVQGELQKSNFLLYFVGGILGLIAIIAIFV
jgi:hypothetical protein